MSINISGELRSFPKELRRVERKDTFALHNEERQKITEIETMIKDNRAETIGSGRSADVILLHIWQNEDVRKPWVVKQENRRTREQELLGTDMVTEFTLHERAYQLVRSAQKENPDISYADIPRPLSLLRDEDHLWMLMDFVPGETLFERTLRQHLLTIIPKDEDDRRSEIARMRKDALLETLFTDEFVNTLPPRLVDEYNNGTLEGIREEHFGMIAAHVNRMTKGPGVVLSQSQYTTLENTINLLHKHGLYHRDLHPSNIQMTEDGRINILDFGFATERARGNTENIYTINVGDGMEDRTVKLPSDDDMLKKYAEIARKIK